MESYLSSFQMMYKSQFQKMDPPDWFVAPGSHIMTGFGAGLVSVASPPLRVYCGVEALTLLSRSLLSVSLWCGLRQSSGFLSIMHNKAGVLEE